MRLYLKYHPNLFARRHAATGIKLKPSGWTVAYYVIDFWNSSDWPVNRTKLHSPSPFNFASITYNPNVAQTQIIEMVITVSSDLSCQILKRHASWITICIFTLRSKFKFDHNFRRKFNLFCQAHWFHLRQTCEITRCLFVGSVGFFLSEKRGCN